MSMTFSANVSNYHILIPPYFNYNILNNLYTKLYTWYNLCMNMLERVKKAKKKLEKISHDYIRRRDGINGELKGYCFDCGKYCEGQMWQCGHFEPSGSSGALLRYHPHNMHGQFGGCNTKYQQEHVKINYAYKMEDIYGREYVNKLRQLKYKIIKADIIFYETMIDLYEQGDEDKIVQYLETCV